MFILMENLYTLNPPPAGQNQKVCQNQKVRGKIRLYQRQRNVNRLFDTKGMNRIKRYEQNIGKTVENKEFQHIGCCRNSLFGFGAAPGQHESGGYGRPQWSQV